MGEKETKLETFRVDFICEHCGKGKMKAMRGIMDGNPPLYPHECDKCGAQMSSSIKYPDYRQREVKEDQKVRG